jgi:nicotinamide riboside kinase
MPPIRKIVVIGPESTGKSTLCERLALHFRTKWVPEFAREYLLNHGKAYDYGDLLKIAKGQIALEDRIFTELSAETSGFMAPRTNPCQYRFLLTPIYG